MPSRPTRSRSFGWTVAAFVIGAAIGGGVGSQSPSAELEELRARVATLEGEVSTAEAQADASEQDAANAEAELREGQEELLDLRRELVRRENALDARARKISAEERRVARTVINDGIWQVGVDIEPGLYRAPGGSGCYWALLRTADTQDIINNGGFGPNQTVQIDSPWFESSNCGEWRKIG